MEELALLLAMIGACALVISALEWMVGLAFNAEESRVRRLREEFILQNCISNCRARSSDVGA